MKRLCLAILSLLWIVYGADAKGSHQLGLMPSLNVNLKLPRDWSLNFKAESRQALYQGDFDFDYLLTDLSMVASTRIRIHATLGGGYLTRITPDDTRHRAIQQVSFSRRYEFFRLAHRVSTDQTFSKLRSPEFRFRYRITSEIPLEGRTLDPKEFFLKFSNEYLNAFQSREYDLEIRTAAYLGYALNPLAKLELGIDYRIDSFLNTPPRNRYWVGFNFYQSIPER